MKSACDWWIVIVNVWIDVTQAYQDDPQAKKFGKQNDCYEQMDVEREYGGYFCEMKEWV